jgi:hypothetical protein
MAGPTFSGGGIPIRSRAGKIAVCVFIAAVVITLIVMFVITKL